MDGHGEGRLGVVGLTASPGDGAGVVVRVAAGPDAESQAGRGLGEVLAAEGIGVVEGADEVAVDVPGDGLLGPVDGVVVVLGLSRGDGVERAAVVAGGVALAKVVGLNLGILAAEPLPVDLIQIIGLDNYTADDTGSGGSLHEDLGAAEEEIPRRLDSWGIALLVQGELSAISAVGDVAGGDGPGIVVGALGEVDLIGALCQTFVGGASFLVISC